MSLSSSSTPSPAPGVALTATTEKELETVALMIDEMMNEDPNVRMHGIKGIPLISRALGPRRTREELVPYVTQLIDDDDEVLLVLMEELFNLTTDPSFLLADASTADSTPETEEAAESSSDKIEEGSESKSAAESKASEESSPIKKTDISRHDDSGTVVFEAVVVNDDDEEDVVFGESAAESSRSLSALKLTCLLPAFERLCCVEEKVIRDAAIAKTGALLSRLPLAAMSSQLLPFVTRLLDCEWHTGRISGAFLLRHVWRKLLTAQRQVARHLFFVGYGGAEADARSTKTGTAMEISSSSGEAVELKKEEEEDIGGETKRKFIRMTVENAQSHILLQLKKLKEICEMKHKCAALLRAVGTDPVPIVRRCALECMTLIVAMYEGIHERKESGELPQVWSLSAAVGGVDDIADELLPLFNKLCRDEHDNVKVFAIDTLRTLLQTFGKGVETVDGSDTVIPAFASLVKKVKKKKGTEDSSDEIRFAALAEACYRRRVEDGGSDEARLLFVKSDGRMLVRKHKLYSRIRDLCTDSSWRVRYMCAQHVADFLPFLSANLVLDSLTDLYVALVSDSEAEVRACAVSHMATFGRFLDCLEGEHCVEAQKAINTSLVTALLKAATDSSKFVRGSVANVLVSFCSILPMETVLECDIVPSILAVLKDECPNVRLSVITAICGEQSLDDGGSKRFDIGLVQESLIPAVVELTLDRDWRVRLSIVETLPHLARRFGREFFDGRLLSLAMGALRDCVAEIRMSAAKQLLEVAKVYRATDASWQWVASVLLPKLKHVHSESSNYLHRLVLLKVYNYLSEAMGKGKNVEMLIEIDALLSDKVPNVRFKACQSLKTLTEKAHIDEATLSTIRIKLDGLLIDETDIDVQYFAGKAASAVERRLHKIARKKDRERQRASKKRE